jgi:hypothetical protein
MKDKKKMKKSVSKMDRHEAATAYSKAAGGTIREIKAQARAARDAEEMDDNTNSDNGNVHTDSGAIPSKKKQNNKYDDYYDTTKRKSSSNDDHDDGDVSSSSDVIVQDADWVERARASLAVSRAESRALGIMATRRVTNSGRPIIAAAATTTASSSGDVIKNHISNPDALLLAQLRGSHTKLEAQQTLDATIGRNADAVPTTGTSGRLANANLDRHRARIDSMMNRVNTLLHLAKPEYGHVVCAYCSLSLLFILGGGREV